MHMSHLQNSRVAVARMLPGAQYQWEDRRSGAAGIRLFNWPIQETQPMGATLNSKSLAAQKPKVKTKAAIKREALREALWPGSERLIWSRKRNDGFTTIPRLLPLVIHLIRELCHKGNPGNVYLDLWTRVFDEGIVSISDDLACAYAAGYTGTRAERTWREHMLRLAELGFIKIAPQGNREIAHILIVNPILVCASLREHRKDVVPDEWWAAFVHRASEIGAAIPTAEQID